MAQTMHCHQDELECERKVQAKARKAGEDEGDVVPWNFTNWHSVSREERARIYRTLSSGDDRKRRMGEEKAQKRAHHAAQLDRKQEESADARRRHLNRRLAFEKSLADSKTRLATTRLQLEAMMQGKTLAQQCEALRDQLRFRELLYGIRKPILIGSGSSDAELVRLKQSVEPLVEQQLPDKMKSASLPIPARQPVAIPSEQSHELTSKHVVRQFQAFQQFVQLTKGGVFRLPPLRSEADDRATTPRQPPAPAAPTAAQPPGRRFGGAGVR